MLWKSQTACNPSYTERGSGYLQFAKPNAKPVGSVITRSACKPKQLFLCCLCRSPKFREFLSAVTVLVTFVTPVPDRHSPVFAFLVDGYLVISMSFAFWAVRSYFLRDFHTDHLNFATSRYAIYLLLMAALSLFFSSPAIPRTSIAFAAPCLINAIAFWLGKDPTSSFL